MKLFKTLIMSICLSVIYLPESLYYNLESTQRREANSILKYEGEAAAIHYINITYNRNQKG